VELASLPMIGLYLTFVLFDVPSSRNLAHVIWVHTPTERPNDNDPDAKLRATIEKKTMVNLVRSSASCFDCVYADLGRSPNTGPGVFCGSQGKVRQRVYCIHFEK
jgi:hypothetical protein